MLRVTLPIGFIFNFPDASFIATAGNASHIPSLEEALQVPGATIDWPAGLSVASLGIADRFQVRGMLNYVAGRTASASAERSNFF